VQVVHGPGASVFPVVQAASPRNEASRSLQPEQA
jgi:hypothetical protein